MTHSAPSIASTNSSNAAISENFQPKQNLSAHHEEIAACTSQVFRCMLQWDIKEVSISDSVHCESDDITCCGIIGLSGAARGSIVVNFSSGVALAATAAFLGTPPKHIDADVVDTVGELTNMIGGSSKDKLPMTGLFLGLPTVIVGKEQTIAFDQGVQMENFRFQTQHGFFTVEIALNS